MKLKTMAIIAPVGLVLLTGCSHESAPPAQISNAPTSTSDSSSSLDASASPSGDATETSSPTGSASSSATASKLSASDEKIVDNAFDVTAQKANSLYHKSTMDVYNQITKPLYGGDGRSVNWVTLQGLGGRVDKDSIQKAGDDGKFSANIIDPKTKKVLAEVTGTVVGDHVNPLSYDETSDGEQYRSDHAAEAHTWATN